MLAATTAADIDTAIAQLGADAVTKVDADLLAAMYDHQLAATTAYLATGRPQTLAEFLTALGAAPTKGATA